MALPPLYKLKIDSNSIDTNYLLMIRLILTGNRIDSNCIDTNSNESFDALRSDDSDK